MDRVPEAELHVGEPEEPPREVPGDEAWEKDGPRNVPKGEPDVGPTRTVCGHGELKRFRMGQWPNGRRVSGEHLRAKRPARVRCTRMLGGARGTCATHATCLRDPIRVERRRRAARRT